MRSSSTSESGTTLRISPMLNSRPTTASVWSNSFCSGGRRSMRAASTACAVDGIRNCETERPTLTVPLRINTPSSNSACNKEGITLGPFYNDPFNRNQFRRLAEQTGQHLGSIFATERVQPELKVVRAVAPFVMIFRPIVHQQQDVGAGYPVCEQIEQ